MPAVVFSRTFNAICLAVFSAPLSAFAQGEPSIDLSQVSRATLKQTLEKVISCSGTPDDEDRLACFDEATEAAFRTNGGLRDLAPQSGDPVEEEDTDPVPASQPADPGNWRVRTMTNPIDDSPTVVLSLTAESGRSEYGNPITFIARCQSNTTEAYIDWGTYVGDDSSSVYNEWKVITVRIGDESAGRQRWGVSTDKEATFAPNWAGTLLKEMLAADRMVVQMTPYGANPITAIFDTQGLDGVLPQLAETCNWSY